MLGNFLSWFCNHPLESLAAMVGLAAVIGLAALRPGMHEHVSQHHPRC